MPRDTVSFPTGLLRVALNSSFIEPRRLVGCRNHPDFSCKGVPHYPITVSVMPHFCTICGVFLSPAQVGPGEIPHQGLEWHQTLRLAPASLSGIGYINSLNEIVALPKPGDFFLDSHAEIQSYVPFFDRDTDCWTFPFHAACWEILLQRIPEAASNIPRIASILHGVLYCTPWDAYGFPRPGHDFGGAAQFQKPVGNPVRKMIGHGYAHLLSSPSRQSSLKDLVRPVHDCNAPPRIIQRLVITDDIFTRLPVEVLATVLTYLPSSSVASLRLASRSVASSTNPMLLPQHFWKSRFLPSFEMGFALPTETDGQPDWRDAYFAIKAALKQTRGCDQLKNRRRIWTVVSFNASLIEQHMTDVVLSGHSCSADDSMGSQSGSDAIERLSSRFIATQLVTNTFGLLQFGTRNIFDRSMLLPVMQGAITLVEVSTVTFNSQVFISGFRFTLDDAVAGDQKTRSLGYTSHAMQTVAVLSPFERVVGFDLAVCAGGLVGVRLVLRSGSRTKKTGWMGNACTNESDVAFGEMPLKINVGQIHVVASFDAFKMVAFGINDGELSDSGPSQSGRLQPIWTPSCPPGTSMLCPEPRPLEYQIFNRFLNVDFGGIHGRRLAHLTRIVAHMFTPKAPLVGLTFYYDQQEPLHFGRQGMTEASFIIDGPGGERIQSVTYEQASNCHGIVALHLLTNFENEVTFTANQRAGPYAADISAFILPGAQHKRIQYTKEDLQSPDGYSILGFTSVLEASNGSFQTFGLQCGKEDGNFLPRTELPVLPLDSRTSSVDLSVFKGSSLIMEASKGCQGYTTASLKGVKLVRFSRGCHSRPRQADEISGLWLEYIDGSHPSILGQWISETDTFTLQRGETITEITIWLSKGRISFSEKYPLGRVVRMTISTSTRCKVYPLEHPPAASQHTILRFQSNDLEELSQLIWAFNERWDFPRVTLATKLPGHHLSFWDPLNVCATRQWMCPQRVLWKLDEGTDSLLSIACFPSSEYPTMIGGMKVAYESSYTFDLGVVSETTMFPELFFDPGDCITQVELFNDSLGLIDISFSCMNAKSGENTTKRFGDSSTVQNRSTGCISHYTISLSQRRCWLAFGPFQDPNDEQDLPQGEVVGLWGFDMAERGLSIGLVFCQEDTE
ncbi:hypothetical protein ASPCADRAFT_509878 [Aspergillus carbonarius ITEM 5010]|uniref:F-box domain-containing protein n=1 Tax=Aspergillus carbonarius (strain ITEM 5010) TaxID=602072 RepID=A0A1R3RBV8_ASPC5|nr:hypothetical protein ASPCADRAFT_509878 [Aspergillus carbonarius ITEM 5010]